VRRRDAALLRALNTPHKRQSEMKMGKPKAESGAEPNPLSKIDLDALGQSVNGFLGFLSTSNQLARVEADSNTAVGADDPVIRFKPSDSLVHFITALGALEFDRLAVK
jgi:hypothetical protein